MNENLKKNRADFLLKSLFKSFPDAILIVDANGTLVEANEAFALVSDCKLSDVLNNKLSQFCFLESAQQEIALDTSLLKDAWDGTVVWRNLEGDNKKLLLTAVRLSNVEQEISGWALIAHPAAGGSNAPMGPQFQKQKLESLGVLSSSIAHDLNNLLTGVLGHVSYIRLADSAEDSKEESIIAIEDGARRAAALTNQILDFARGEKVELETLNFSLIVSASVNLLRASLPDSIRLKTHNSKDDIFIFGDESQLSQLTMNLLVNAKDALIPKGGELDITLSQVEIDVYKVSGDFEIQPGTYASLLIKDTGEGIPDDIKQRIFEPFFTTKKDKGTGIGLATVFSIVKAHRGCIELETQEGVGTSFEILLPIGENSSDRKVSFSKPEAVERGSERILVVDDEQTVRTVMQRSLEHLGYQVLIAEDGLKGLELYKQEDGNFDLIILDMIMPKMSGDELFYELLSLKNTTPVLIATGYSSDVKTKAVMRDGAKGFIQKPFAVEELAQEVRKCLDQSEY